MGNLSTSEPLEDYKESEQRIRTNIYNRAPRSMIYPRLGSIIRSKRMLRPVCTGWIRLAVASKDLAVEASVTCSWSLSGGRWDPWVPRKCCIHVVRAGACYPKTYNYPRYHRQRGGMGKFRPLALHHCPFVDLILLHHTDQWRRMHLTHLWFPPRWYLWDGLNDQKKDSLVQCR